MTQALRIGLLADSTDPFWVEVRETIWQHAEPRTSGAAFDAAGFNGLAPLPSIELIEIHLSAEARIGHDALNRVEEILALNLGALIAVPFAMPVIRRLIDAGLPVISLHARDIHHPLFTSPTSLYATACLACEFLAERIGDEGRVLGIGGHSGAPETRSSRVQAAIDVFSRYPGIEFVHVPTPWNYDDAVAPLCSALEEVTQPFDGVFGLSDTLALLGQKVTIQHGLLRRNATVVGINGDPLAIAAIARGDMTATVATSAAYIALEALRLAREAAQGRPLPSHFDYHPQLITIENVSEIALTKLLAIADVPSRLVGVNLRQEEQRMTQLQTSLEINRRIGSILDREQLLGEIAELIRTNYGYDHAQIFLLADDAQELTCVLPVAVDGVGQRLRLAEAGILGEALLRNHAIFLVETPRAQEAPVFGCSDTRSRAVIPIHVGGRTLGIMDLHSRTVRRFNQVDLDALQSLADQLGVAMRNAQLYSEALEARATAERADQLKTRLLANVSHELRTPLNIILGYSQSALSEPSPYEVALPKELRQDLQHIVRSGDHLVRLIDDLLNLSQAEIGALEIYPECINVHRLLSEVFESMAGGASAPAVDWRLQLPTHLPELLVDPLRLRQVLLNLLSNAAKFTTAGHITLSAAVETPDLHIWVEDTGTGIPAALQVRLFEAFESTATETGHGRHGVGLGLAVAQHLVRLHGGSLNLESRAGHGTVCHIRLPLAGTSPETPAPLASAPGPDELDRVLHASLVHASELTRNIAVYIMENYTENITREQIAESMRISTTYVSRVFHKETGMTPWQFLARYRIVQAQKLLLTSTHNVTEIAALVGFNDTPYFVRVFHKETGKSPQQYRKHAR